MHSQLPEDLADRKHAGFQEDGGVSLRNKRVTWSITYPVYGPDRLSVDGHGCWRLNALLAAEDRLIAGKRSDALRNRR
jgi:hypothetical protein